VRILLVEDQDSIRSLIEALVSARGHQVVAAKTGAKALELALIAPPDIVLLDLHLPGSFDGFDVCERLRANPTTSAVPVVVISASDDTENRARAARTGATSYFGKPFSPMALLKDIESLGRRRPA
jgi:DNA-binding response OmpR family regulator